MGNVFSNMSGLDWFFLMNAVLPALSVPMYLFKPDGTAKHFGGTPTPTSRTWVQLAGSGDALCSFMCASAIGAQSNVQQLALAGVVLYSTLHVGTFLWGHKKNVPMPKQLVYQCSIGLFIPPIVAAWAHRSSAFRL